MIHALTKCLSLFGLLLLAVAANSQSSDSGEDRCRITEEGRLVCDPAERAKLGPDVTVKDFFSDYVQGDALRPTRLFAGPDLYPPENYRGYGILAFPARATGFDRERHLMICAAFMATLPDTHEVDAPTQNQFVTIWPVRSDEVATEIREMAPDAACDQAIASYSEDAAFQAIKAAEAAGFRDDGVGPYLLAWSPPADIGRADAFVLALDLSNVRSYEQALALMQEWNRDIETDFEILSNGFTLERLRNSIRHWADTYGDGFLQLIRSG